MKFGLDCSQHQLTWEEVLERVRFAEDTGFDGAWVFDHFKALYGDPTGPCFEAWTLLAGLAARTERIRLGALVTGVTYRHPSILTTEAVTIDHISNGRLELAIGAAWFEGEHRELGIDFPSNGERARRLEEALDVMKLLMTDDEVSFDGRYYRLDHATYRPRPVQQPYPPIWIGAGGEKLMLPIVGRHADVWHGFGSLGALRRKWEVVARAAEAAGRDPQSIVRSTDLSLSEPWDEVRTRLEALRDAGFTYVTVSWPSEGKQRLDEYIEKVMPDFADS
ncbi:MAG: TIGR03560 family F420-dependent LLM class oxidoreductase [Actinomycetota bacterium]|nr:TIGR03560 family F420-dependent LLM class oxidoreductase [Actinomycetota bacterium]